MYLLPAEEFCVWTDLKPVFFFNGIEIRGNVSFKKLQFSSYKLETLNTFHNRIKINFNKNSGSIHTFWCIANSTSIFRGTVRSSPEAISIQKHTFFACFFIIFRPATETHMFPIQPAIMFSTLAWFKQKGWAYTVKKCKVQKMIW